MNTPHKIIVLLLWVVLAAALGFAWKQLIAGEVARAVEGDAVVILTDEPCAIAAVRNLPYRVVWQEREKKYEGCYHVHPSGIVVMYFDDRTVGIVPLRVFRRGM